MERNMNEQRVETIRERLLDALDPELLEIADESHLHAGHAGARDGRGHFRVMIVSPAFTGETRIRRHQLIYAALGEMMQTDIHALAIQALAPGEI
jgi:BolA family transcriptional regulator, general stress-responsive regulator